MGIASLHPSYDLRSIPATRLPHILGPDSFFGESNYPLTKLSFTNS